MENFFDEIDKGRRAKHATRKPMWRRYPISLSYFLLSSALITAIAFTPDPEHVATVPFDYLMGVLGS